MSTIEQEIEKEKAGTGCCGGSTKQNATTSTAKEVEGKKPESEEKKSGSGCCGG